MVKINVNTNMGTAGLPGLQAIKTDLLVLTKLAGMELGPGPRAVDTALGGLLTQRMQERRFRGDCLEHILIDLQEEGYTDVPQRYILLVGLGSPARFCSHGTCKVFRLVLDKAVELGVDKVTIPFPPKRVTGPGLNLKGTAALLKRVVVNRFGADGEQAGDGVIDTVEIVSTPQARRYIQSGLRSRAYQADDCCD